MMCMCYMCMCMYDVYVLHVLACVSAGRYTDIFGKYRYFPIYRYRTVVVFQYRNTEYRGTAKKNKTIIARAQHPW